MNEQTAELNPPPVTKKQSTCRICGFVGEANWKMRQHYKQAHPDHVPKARAVKTTAAQASPLDAIREHERGIRDALHTLDEERTGLMNRIKEIDDTVAKWRKI